MKKLAHSKSPKKFKYHEMVKSGKVNHNTPKSSKDKKEIKVLNQDLAHVSPSVPEKPAVI